MDSVESDDRPQSTMEPRCGRIAYFVTHAVDPRKTDGATAFEAKR